MIMSNEENSCADYRQWFEFQFECQTGEYIWAYWHRVFFTLAARSKILMHCAAIFWICSRKGGTMQARQDVPYLISFEQRHSKQSISRTWNEYLGHVPLMESWSLITIHLWSTHRFYLWEIKDTARLRQSISLAPPSENAKQKSCLSFRSRDKEWN